MAQRSKNSKSFLRESDFIGICNEEDEDSFFKELTDELNF